MRSHPSEFRLYGIFGFPLGHTFSPVMQEAAFRAVGLKAFYLPFEIRPAEFRRLMRGLPDLQLDGFNVTVPYKEVVLPYVDGLSPSARAIGAVNTVVRKGSRWIGHNTDWTGFIALLEKGSRFRIRGKRVLILGAGGSARAVAYGLAKRGVHSVIIANRTVARAQKIVRDFRVLFPRTHWMLSSLRDSVPNEVEAIPEIASPRRSAVRLAMTSGTLPRNDWLMADLVVNATSVGLKPGGPSLIQANGFPKKTFFADLIYKPAETNFLRLARKSGHRTLNGMGMLVHQGAEAFRLWTGRKPPVKVMYSALKKALTKR